MHVGQRWMLHINHTGADMSALVQQAAQNAASAVNAAGYQSPVAHGAVQAFQMTYNQMLSAEAADPNFSGPPATPLTVDGIWGPKTYSAAVSSGVPNAPAAYFAGPSGPAYVPPAPAPSPAPAPAPKPPAGKKKVSPWWVAIGTAITGAIGAIIYSRVK